MRTLGKIADVCAVVIAMVVSAPTFAQEAKSTEIGILECEVDGSANMLLISSQRADCTLTAHDGSKELYSGQIGKVAIALALSNDAYVGWVVFSTSADRLPPFSLAGEYYRISDDSAIGIGLGINALVGGPPNSIGLQPYRIAGRSGLNVAAGVKSVVLTVIQ